MATQLPERNPGILLHHDHPLIGVITQQDGEDLVRYFTDDEDAETASGSQGMQRALSLLGAWQGIDSDDALDELDRIRHESKPTPPIEL